MSYGWFNERRVEGYGTFPLPHLPGKYTIEVETWKPKTSLYNRSDDLDNKMRSLLNVL